MENTDIPQFRTYRGEIELEGVVIQVDIFVDNEMLEDRNSFLISFLCKLVDCLEKCLIYGHIRRFAD